MPFPTKETFSRIWDDFFTTWNLPNCIHCIDGKNMKIKCPALWFNLLQLSELLLNCVPG
jgi:hypothetical protein